MQVFTTFFTTVKPSERFTTHSRVSLPRSHPRFLGISGFGLTHIPWTSDSPETCVAVLRTFERGLPFAKVLPQAI